MCDNSNLVGGGSLEIGAEEPKLNQSIESHISNKNEGLLPKQTEVPIQASKAEGEGNSSIDMPSFQTEHDAMFLWNKARIVETKNSMMKPSTRGSSIVEKGRLNDSLMSVESPRR